VQQYLNKLSGLGLEVEEEQIVTSAVVLAEVLRERNVAGRTALVVGGAGAVEAIEGLGVSILRDPSADEADMVIVGLDVNFDYDALRRASTAVREGATLIATNSDASYPVAGGLWPGSGSILAAIEVASGGTAEVMGKPYRPMMESALRRLPDASQIAMVGDRPDTDLAGATAMGWTTILVLSGVTTPEEASALDPSPDLVLGSLAELVE
jgi:4-nitrophenyl phosphatase